MLGVYPLSIHVLQDKACSENSSVPMSERLKHDHTRILLFCRTSLGKATTLNDSVLLILLDRLYTGWTCISSGKIRV